MYAAPAVEGVTVVCAPTDEKLKIFILLSGSQRRLNLERSKDEELCKGLMRLQLNFDKGKAENVKSRRLNASPSPSPSADISCRGPKLRGESREEIDGKIRSIDGWKEARFLEIGGETLTVHFNPPRCFTATSDGPFDCVPIVGCPVVPRLAVQFCEMGSLEFEWRLDGGAEMGGPRVVSNECIYIPGEEAKGCRPKLRVHHPDAPLFLNEYEMKHPVVEFKTVAWNVRRNAKFRAQKRTKATNAFTISSFNILAAIYAESDYAVQVMYPYCHSKHLDIQYRKLLIAHELTELDSDIHCLQECGDGLFSSFLEPFMRSQGFSGFYEGKTGRGREGSAIFVRNSKFSVESSEAFSFQEVLETPDAKLQQQITELKKNCPSAFIDVIPRMAQIFHFVTLRPRAAEGRPLIVGNTHLFFHPDAGYIRLLQIAGFVHRLEQLRKCTGSSMSAIICGDFNSPSFSGGYHLMHHWKISASHPIWKNSLDYKFVEEAADTPEKSDGHSRPPPPEAKESPTSSGMRMSSLGVDIDLPDSLRLWDSHRIQPTGLESEINVPEMQGLSEIAGTGTYRFTNFVDPFKEVLDYLFISDDLECDGILEPPPREELLMHGGLPCEFYASDHLSIAAHLEFKNISRGGDASL